jgi:hypothetical protein
MTAGLSWNATVCPLELVALPLRPDDDDDDEALFESVLVKGSRSTPPLSSS